MTATSSQKTRFWKRKGFLWTAGILVGVAVIGSFMDDPKPSAPTATQPAVVQNQQPTPSQKVAIGENGYIKVTSPKTILADTKTDLDELTKIYLANDTAGIQEFLLSGKGFSVSNGTKILVIDTGVGVRKVRVLEGDNINGSGWLPMEFVVKNK